MHARFSVLLLSAALLTGNAAATSPNPGPIASAALRGTDGSDKGTATIVAVRGKIELQLAVQGLPAGEHGTHLHTVGRCDAPDFTSAGGHLNPHGKMHGSENPQGAHLGDLPNLNVGDNGKGALIASIPGTAEEVAAALFDADGTAIVIHAGTDDYKTDPSGNSGGRIICGVLTRAR